MQETIKKTNDILNMLDSFFPNEKNRWNKFFSTLPASHPLSSELPDENLIEWVVSAKIKKGKALDIGCGNGRNAVYLSKQGFEVDALDLSSDAIEKAKRKAQSEGASVNFTCSSLFDFQFQNQEYDLVYDAGLLHHIFPHRRPEYLKLVASLTKKGGHFGLVAFNEKMGTKLSDWQIYKERSMEGGMSFPLEKLEFLFSGDFKCLEYREMKSCSPTDGCFGVDFVSASLWQKHQTV